MLRALIVLGGLATLVGFLGGAWWIGDLASHFRLHYAAGLLVCGGGALALGRGRLAALAAVLVALNPGPVAPSVLARADAPPDSVGPILRVLSPPSAPAPQGNRKVRRSSSRGTRQVHAARLTSSIRRRQGSRAKRGGAAQAADPSSGAAPAPPRERDLALADGPSEPVGLPAGPCRGPHVLLGPRRCDRPAQRPLRVARSRRAC